MMRRRKKEQRAARRPPREPGAAPAAEREAPRARRRARADTPVPAELAVTVPADPAPAAPAATVPRPAGPIAPAGGVEDVVLVTGFDPFGGEPLNPSWEVCTRLPREIAGLRVEIRRVPCEFRACIEAVAEDIERHRPAIVLCLGQAGGRAQVSVERVAINVDDARIEDNAAARPVDRPIASGGPAAYFATVPIKAMAAAIRAAGVPAHVSNSAGTYVCNHLMYGVLHFLAASGHGARAGFLHLPYAEGQVLDKPAMPSLSLDSMVRSVQAAIAAARAHERDIPVSEGTLD